jgi:hypothetical protein
MGQQAAARVRDDNVRWLNQNKIGSDALAIAEQVDV